MPDTKPLWQLAADKALADLLGGFRETATHPAYGPYGYVGASRMNRRTHDAIVVAAHVSGWGPVTFTQGGLNSSVAASANTHKGLDVVDVQTRGRPIDSIRALVAAGMDCGVVLFIRGISQDSIADGMIEHCHGVMIRAQHAHPDARAQLYGWSYSYDRGGAGLAGIPKARWWGPARKPMIEWAASKYNPANGWRP